MSERRRRPTVALALLLATGVGLSATPTDDGLLSLSFSELLDVEIFSSAQRQERYFQSASAGFVLTRDMAATSGATHLMDLLRLAPGVQVAQVNTGSWSVGVRGDASLYTPNLLVLRDGVSMYHPGFSGVFWSEMAASFDELEQVEVVRGPGGAAWGANAMNGVLNVISRSARDTQGDRVELTVGTEQKARVHLRHGGASENGKWFHRVSVSYAEAGAMGATSPLPAVGSTRDLRASARIDYEPSDSPHVFTLQADGWRYRTRERLFYALPTAPFPRIGDIESEFDSATVRAKWRRESGESSSEVQAYYRMIEIAMPTMASQSVDVFDVTFRRDGFLGERHRLLWTGNVRHQRDHYFELGALQIDRPKRDETSVSLALQDDWILVPDRAAVIAGAKLERTIIDDYELQPSLKFRWTPDARNTLWTSVARAVRTPGRVNRDAAVWMPSFDPVGAVLVAPNPDMQSDRLWAFEAGWRRQLGSAAIVDVTGFSNRYENVSGVLPPTSLPGPPGLTLATYSLANEYDADSHGLEGALDWTLHDRLRVRGSIAYVKFRHGAPFTTSTNVGRGDLRSTLFVVWNARRDIDASAVLRHVSSQRSVAGFASAYVTGDLRVAWRPRYGLEVALVGRNLFAPSTRESVNASYPIEDQRVERGGSLQLAWSF